MTIPFERATSQPPQAVQAAPVRASTSSRRWAAVAAVVLLLAVAASAAYVFVFQKGRPQPAATSTSELASPALAQPDSKPADKETASGASSAISDPAQKSENASRDELKKAVAEKEKLEKKLADEQKRNSEQGSGQGALPPKPDAPAVQPPSVPQPAPQTAPSVDGGTPAPGEACLAVGVSGPSGEPAAQLRVVLVPGGDDSRMLNGRTNPKGRILKCGLKPGQMVRVAVFGPRGAIIGTKTAELKPGRNFIEMVVITPAMRNADRTTDDTPFPNRRNRPRLKGEKY